LAHIARNLTGVRLLIVGTYRDVEVDRAHPLSSTLAELRRASSFGRVALRGLTVDEVHRMITIMSGQEAPWGLAEAIHRQTEGNPLFIQEVLRYIVEEGMVTRQDGRWQGTGNTPLEMSIPEGLRDVIGKRLSRLSPECNRLLTVAAVIGRDFALETLRAVSEIEEEPLIAAIEEAVRVGVLEEKSRAGSVQYRYAHAFFRQTLYEEMIAPRRIRLHQQVARALESQYAARLEEHAVELAEHFSYSSDPADLSKAVEYGEMAARRAIAVYAYGEAVGHLERCLQVQEVLDLSDSAKRCDLLLALAESLMPAGEPMRAVEEVAPQALALAEALDDRVRSSRVCRLALEGLYRYGNVTIYGTQSYSHWAERADRHALPNTAGRLYADIAMGNVRHVAGQHTEAAALFDRALELARELDQPEALFLAAGERIGPGNSPQRQEKRLRLTEELTRERHEGVSARTLGHILHRSALAYLDWGQRERAEEMLRQLAELAGRTKDPEPVLRALYIEGILLTLDGRLEAALEAGERLLARADELGAPVFGRQFRNGMQLRPLLYLGRGEEVLSLLPQAAQTAGAEEVPGIGVQRGVCLAHLGRVAEAQSLLQLTLTQFGVGPAEDEVPITILTNLLETAVLVGDGEAAGVLAQRLSGVASMLNFGGTCIARHLGAAAALLGDKEKARAYYRQALEVCAKVRHRPEAALTHLQLAELLLQEAEDARRSQGRGDLAPTDVVPDVGVGPPDPKAAADAMRKEAMERLDFAISEFQEMKMQPSLERALRHKGLLRA